MMKRALTVALMGGAALTLAAPAYAFTPQEDEVIRQMDAAGYNHALPEMVIDNAHQICAEIGRGVPRPEVALSLGMGAGIGPDEATKFVDVSVANLCP
jgi:hypothetical protein